jgi:hypothetical protein
MKYLPLLLLLSSCSPSFGGGGFIVQLGLGLAAAWTWGRFFGWTPFVKQPVPPVKGTRGTFIYAAALTVAAIVTYFLMASTK